MALARKAGAQFDTGAYQTLISHLNPSDSLGESVMLCSMEKPVTDTLPSPFTQWGFWAVVLGAIALVLVFVQIAGPMMEPKPSAGQQIGEIAGEIKRSAWRTFFGLSKETAEPEPVSPMVYLGLAAPILGVLAIVLSVISGVLRENRRYMVYGTGLGATAIVFHFFWWVAVLLVGVLLLIYILENIGDIFSFW